MKSAEEAHLLNTAEAAEYLAISKATLETWRSRQAQPSLRFVKLGGSVRYKKSDLDRFVESSSVGS